MLCWSPLALVLAFTVLAKMILKATLQISDLLQIFIKKNYLKQLFVTSGFAKIFSQYLAPLYKQTQAEWSVMLGSNLDI